VFTNGNLSLGNSMKRNQVLVTLQCFDVDLRLVAITRDHIKNLVVFCPSFRACISILV
jgi:hypothetical protein